MIRTLLWSSLLCLTSIATAQEAPIVRVNTRLVEMDVVVHSKGEAVTDLKQDDFTVLDNGKPQKIAAFSVVSSQTSRGKAIPLPPGAVSNRLNTDGKEPAGATIVLFDTLNTATSDQGYARQQLLKYLGTLKPGDHFALYNLSKVLRVVQDFTDDPDRLVQAARRYGMETSTDETADGLAADLLADAPSTGDPIADAMFVSSVKEMQDAAHVNRAVITGKMLELIAKHLQGLPGRKTLVWLGSSFQAQTTDIRSHNGHDTIEHREFSRRNQLGRPRVE